MNSGRKQGIGHTERDTVNTEVRYNLLSSRHTHSQSDSDSDSLTLFVGFLLSLRLLSLSRSLFLFGIVFISAIRLRFG